MQVEIADNLVVAKAGQKKVWKKFEAKKIKISQENGCVVVFSQNGKKKSVAVVNSIASAVQNLFFGLEKDFEYRLEIVYSHFPINVSVKDGFVEISNLGGAKMPRKGKIIGSAKVVVKGKEVIVSAPNKEEAGQTSANIESAAKILGKDKRIFQDGVYIVSKPAAEG